MSEHWIDGVGGKPGFDIAAWVKPHREFSIKATPIWIDAVKAEFGMYSGQNGFRSSKSSPGTPDTTYGCVGKYKRAKHTTMISTDH